MIAHRLPTLGFRELRRHTRGALLLVFCCCLSVASSTSVVAQGTSGKSLLIPGINYTVTLNTQWVNGYGYRPVRVSIMPNVVPTVDEVITVRLSTSDDILEGNAIVEQDIVVPARTVNGSPVAGEGIIHVPVYDGWQQLTMHFVRNGQVLPRLSRTHNFNMSLGTGSWWTGGGTSNASQTMLLVDSAHTLLKPPVTAPINRPGGLNQTGVVTIGPVANPAARIFSSFDTLALHPRELTTSWLDLTSADVVSISITELQAMQSQFPGQFAALHDWIFSGGSLWIYDIQDDLSQLPEIDAVFGLDDDAATAWRMISDLRNSTENDFVDLDQVSAEQPGTTALPQGGNPNLGAIALKLRWRSLGMGTVAAVPMNKPDGSPEWDQASIELETLSRSWIMRHGLTPHSTNGDFWNYLIPGVGMPPVTAFEILITLFVVVIGPVNYIILRKRRRLHLLVITVPLMAILVTFSLFAYALASDGFGVRVMARSFTYLDQRQNQAACWTRMSYYAGIAPSRGLAFSEDVAVYPINGLMNYGPDAMSPRHTTWGDNRQQLGIGWMESRTPMQLMTVRSRTSNYQLKVTENAGSAPNVQNLLGTRVKELVLCDSDGATFLGRDIGLDATQELAPLASDPDRIVDLRNAISFSMPDMVDSPRGRFNYWGNNEEEGNAQTSLLEVHLDAATGLLGSRSAKLSPRSYIALVELSPECQFGVQSPQQEASLHVIYGRW